MCSKMQVFNLITFLPILEVLQLLHQCLYMPLLSRKSISSFLYLWINIFERYFNITKIFDNISNVMAIVVYAICWDTLHFCRPSIYYLQFLVIIKLIFFIELKLNYLYIFLEIELFIWFTVPVSFFT